jgi:hypothetical protein
MNHKWLPQPGTLLRVASYLIYEMRSATVELHTWTRGGRNNREGYEATMFGFVGTDKKRGQIVGLNVLRVHQNDFKVFLETWAEWLSKTSILKTLSRSRLIAAE